jgi:hypothetical protein
MFPVDPRDFGNQDFSNSVDTCVPSIHATDPPVEGRYLYSWSLGDPFLKRCGFCLQFGSAFGALTAILDASVLSSYHYGNLTYPSQDPPRMGFLSTVPADADEQLKAAVQAAAQDGGNFPGWYTLGFVCPLARDTNACR